MVYQYFRQWRDDCTLDRILAHLYLRKDRYLDLDLDLDVGMIDVTKTRATPTLVGGKKAGRANHWIMRYAVD